MRSFVFYLAIFCGVAWAVPNATNYVAPARVVRDASEVPTTLAPADDEEDLGPLGEVQLDVEEEDLKVRVRRGYSSGGGGQRGGSKYGGGGQSQGKYGGESKYGGGESKYGGGGSKYGGGGQNQQNQGGYGQQKQQGGRYGGNDGGNQGGYY